MLKLDLDAAHHSVPLIAAAANYPGQLGLLVPTISDGLRVWGASGHTDAGWKIWTYGPNMVSDMTYNGQPSTHSMILAMSGTNPQIELIEALDGPSIYHDWINSHGYGLHHLGLYIDDVAAMIPRMEQANFAMVQSGRAMGADGSGAYAYFDTTELLGFYLEAIEVPTVRREPHQVWPDGREER